MIEAQTDKLVFPNSSRAFEENASRLVGSRIYWCLVFRHYSISCVVDVCTYAWASKRSYVYWLPFFIGHKCLRACSVHPGERSHVIPCWWVGIPIILTWIAMWSRCQPWQLYSNCPTKVVAVQYNQLWHVSSHHHQSSSSLGSLWPLSQSLVHLQVYP